MCESLVIEPDATTKIIRGIIRPGVMDAHYTDP
jgi:hypothetical protein